MCDRHRSYGNGLFDIDCCLYRVPIARLTAAQANLKAGGSNRDR